MAFKVRVSGPRVKAVYSRETAEEAIATAREFRSLADWTRIEDADGVPYRLEDFEKVQAETRDRM
jgi:hypothetical protein